MSQNNRSVFYIVSIIAALSFLALGFQNCTEGFNAINQETANSGSDSGASAPPPQNTRVSFAHVESCLKGSGSSNLISCLEASKLDVKSFSQDSVDACVADSGDAAFDLSLCMARNGLAPSGYRNFRQLDVDTCLESVNEDSLAGCLDNKGILPENTEQSTFDSCISAVGTSKVEFCMRKNSLIPPSGVFMQASSTMCRKIFGEDLIAKCLVDSELVPKNLQQSDVSTCITNSGAEGVAKCLRETDVIPTVLIQAHIEFCAQNAGKANIAICMESNGLNKAILINNFEQANINTCIFNGGLEGVSDCLVGNTTITGDISQDHINACYRVAGKDMVADCLEKSAILPSGLVQGDFALCESTLGKDNVDQCLRDSGKIASLARLKTGTGVFAQNCSSCHMGGNTSGSFDMDSYASILSLVKPGVATQSELYLRMTSTGGDVMPKSGMLGAEELEQVRLWILQGAPDN